MTKQKDLYLIYAISFMDLFSVGLTFPLLSNHLRELGASHFIVGLINSLYSGSQVISGPVIGSWSDIRGRKPVLITTLLCCSLSYVLLGLTNLLVIITIIRFLLGVTKHTQSLCKAIITDLLPVKERAGAFGKSAAFSSIGFIAGPIIGGHLSELTYGFSYVSFLTGVLFIINIGLASMITTDFPNINNPIKDESYITRIRQDFYKSLSELTTVDWSVFWDTFLLRFIFGCAISMYFSQQSVYLREHFNLSQRHIGYTISYFSTVGTISAFLLHHINEYFYKDDDSFFKRLGHFFTLMTVSLVCLSLSPNIQTFLIFLTPFSVSCAILRIVSMELMLKQAASAHRGSLSGTSNSIMSVARFITPISSGLINDKFGGSIGLLFSAFPPLIGTILSYRMKLKSNKTKTN